MHNFTFSFDLSIFWIIIYNTLYNIIINTFLEYQISMRIYGSTNTEYPISQLLYSSKDLSLIEGAGIPHFFQRTTAWNFSFFLYFQHSLNL